nr:uncharacterized protein LOC127304320 [Lolium perenne]
MPSRRGTAPRGVAIAGIDLVGQSFHPEQAPSRRGLLHRQDSHMPARKPLPSTTSPTNTPPLPGAAAPPPTRTLPQQPAAPRPRRTAAAASRRPDRALPSTTAPHSARRTTRAAARLRGRPRRQQAIAAAPTARRTTSPAPRSPDNQPRPRSGPGRPARRHLLPRHGHAAAARSAQLHHPPPQRDGDPGPPPGFLPPGPATPHTGRSPRRRSRTHLTPFEDEARRHRGKGRRRQRQGAAKAGSRRRGEGGLPASRGVRREEQDENSLRILGRTGLLNLFDMIEKGACHPQ